MNALNVVLIMVGCILLGIVGAVAARSIFAGILLAVLVFGGWFLWKLFKLQNEKEGIKEQEEPKNEETPTEQVPQS